jgi:hypothetical protein
LPAGQLAVTDLFVLFVALVAIARTGDAAAAAPVAVNIWTPPSMSAAVSRPVAMRR